jgi:hypothetical protein
MKPTGGGLPGPAMPGLQLYDVVLFSFPLGEQPARFGVSRLTRVRAHDELATSPSFLFLNVECRMVCLHIHANLDSVMVAYSVGRLKTYTLYASDKQLEENLTE